MNLLEIIRFMPVDRSLYTVTHGKALIYELTGHFIHLRTIQGQVDVKLGQDGKQFEDGECVLFPSKTVRDWTKWQAIIRKGDFVVRNLDKVAFVVQEMDETNYLTLLYNDGTTECVKHFCVIGWANPTQISIFKAKLEEAGYEIQGDSYKKIESLKPGVVIRYHGYNYMIEKMDSNTIYLISDTGQKTTAPFDAPMYNVPQKQVEIFKENFEYNKVHANKSVEQATKGKCMKCLVSFGLFKKGETYWFEHVQDNEYIGKSNNILDQTITLLPHQLFYFIDINNTFLLSLYEWIQLHFQVIKDPIILNNNKRFYNDKFYEELDDETAEQSDARICNQYCQKLYEFIYGPTFDSEDVIQKIESADSNHKIVLTSKYNNSDLYACDIDKFISLPIESQLYDLNLHDEALFTLLRAGNIEAVNKIAINKILKLLKQKIEAQSICNCECKD